MKIIKIDCGRHINNLKRPAGYGNGPVIGVQIKRNWKWRWYKRVKIHGDSVVLEDKERRLVDGTTLRITTNAPLTCETYDGQEEYWD